MKYEMIAGRKIFFEETYYVAYAGRKRDMTAKDEKEYNKLLTLPFDLRASTMDKNGPAKNPNLIPVSGKTILELIIDGKCVPFFDLFFDKTKTLQVSDLIVYESLKAKSYQVALGL